MFVVQMPCPKCGNKEWEQVYLSMTHRPLAEGGPVTESTWECTACHYRLEPKEKE